MAAVKWKEGESPLLEVLFTTSIILPTLLLRTDALLFLMFLGEGKTQISGAEDNSKIFFKTNISNHGLAAVCSAGFTGFRDVKISSSDTRMLTDP